LEKVGAWLGETLNLVELFGTQYGRGTMKVAEAVKGQGGD